MDPQIKTEIPGPRSREIWEREKQHMTSGLDGCTLLAHIAFERGEGSIVWDVDGNSYIDCAAGVLTNSTGHCHPKVVKALQDQAAKLWHVHNFPTPQKYELCELLAEKFPAGVDTFAFYSGGTETVEAGIRAASSYTKRHEFISFHQAYHGRTLAVRGLAPWWGKGFGPVGNNGIRSPFAYCYRCPFAATYPACDLRCAKYLKDAIQFNSTGSVAGIIFEPIQGAGGVIVPPDGFLQQVIEIAREHGALVLADEILTGIGRTGKFFAFEYWNIEPDLVFSGKGLGSGFPVMVLGGKHDIMTQPPFGSAGGASTSFGGNPLATAVALATMQVINEEDLLTHTQQMGQILKDRFAELKEKHPLIGDVRGMGLLWGIELVKDRVTKEPAQEEGRMLYLECLQHGLKTITPGHLTRFSPPLNIPRDELEMAVDIYDTALTIVEKKFGYRKA
jgi:4-aminobutyrate aminotransferase/(S)-3-amino-2-methylpropionate transaminase